MPSSLPPDRLTAAQERDLEQRVNQFEEAWQGPKSPRLEGFLPPASDGSYRRRVLQELITIDLERRWSQGPTASSDTALPTRPRLEDYLRSYPELGANPPSLDLIGEEYRVRRLFGDRPAPAEYASRFPSHGSRVLARLTEIDNELAEEFANREALRKPPSQVVQPGLSPSAPDRPVTSCSDLVRVLKTCGLLTPARTAELERDWQKASPEPRALARELLARNWLTAYQVNQLFLGRAQDLVIGSYRVLERLGEGGAGQVFKAQHQAMNRIVALKVIRRELLTEPEVVNRFYREIALVGQLSHPHIVHAYDAGPIGATHFLAMEYVEGTDLHRLVKQGGPLPVETACDYLRQAALGLQHAHERGLVHRDIKPANLLLTQRPGTPGGIIRVLDMGLARLHQTLVDGEVTSVLTPVGSMMMGTPDYMAPEQAVNFHAADIRADIYSLGCTFHYLLTGQPPFPGGNLTEKLLRHQQAKPPGLPGGKVPPAVAAIVRKMLAKRPEERFQTPAAVAQTLGDVCAATFSISSESRKRRLRLLPVAGTGFALLGLLVGILWISSRKQPSSAGPESAAAVMQRLLGQVSTSSADLESLRQLVTAFRRNYPDEQESLRRGLLDLRAQSPGTPVSLRASELLPYLPSPLDQLERKDIPPAERFDWQPDSLVGVLGEHRLRHWGSVRSAAYSPDGKWMATAGDDALVRLWSPVKNELIRGLAGHRKAVGALAFTADSKVLASAGDDGTVRFWDPSTGSNWAILEAHSRPIRAIAFSPDSKILATGSEDWTAKLWDVDPAGRRVALQPRNVVREHRGPVNALAFLPPKGHVLASGGSDGTIGFWDTRSSQALTPFNRRTGEVHSLACAADGKTVFAGIRLTPAKGEVIAWDVPGRKELVVPSGNASLPYALTMTGARTVAAACLDGVVRQWEIGGKLKEAPSVKWSGAIHALACAPDGRAVLMGRSDGLLMVHRIDPLGDFPLGSEVEVGQIAVAADGRTILVGEGVPGRPLRQGRLCVWDVSTGFARPLVLGSGPGPSAVAMSWDGRLAAAADQAGKLRVWDWPSRKERSAWEALPEKRVLRGLAFSPDGRALIASEHTGKEPAGLRKWDVSTGRLSTGFQAPLEPNGYFSLAITSDSRLLAVGHLQHGVKVLDAATGKELASIPVNPATRRQNLVFAEDGRTLAIGAGGSSVKFWDPRDNKELPPLRASTGFNAVCGLAFMHGPSLVAVTPDGQIIHWPRLPADKNTTLVLPGTIRVAAVSSDGRHLLTANTNGTVYIFRLAPVAESPGR